MFVFSYDKALIKASQLADEDLLLRTFRNNNRIYEVFREFMVLRLEIKAEVFVTSLLVQLPNPLRTRLVKANVTDVPTFQHAVTINKQLGDDINAFLATKQTQASPLPLEDYLFRFTESGMKAQLAQLWGEIPVEFEQPLFVAIEAMLEQAESVDDDKMEAAAIRVRRNELRDILNQVLTPEACVALDVVRLQVTTTDRAAFDIWDQILPKHKQHFIEAVTQRADELTNPKQVKRMRGLVARMQNMRGKKPLPSPPIGFLHPQSPIPYAFLAFLQAPDDEEAKQVLTILQNSLGLDGIQQMIDMALVQTPADSNNHIVKRAALLREFRRR